MEYFIRSKPELAAEHNLTALLRRRVYEQEVDISWGLEEFKGVSEFMCIHICSCRACDIPTNHVFVCYRDVCPTMSPPEHARTDFHIELSLLTSNCSSDSLKARSTRRIVGSRFAPLRACSKPNLSTLFAMVKIVTVLPYPIQVYVVAHISPKHAP